MPGVANGGGGGGAGGGAGAGAGRGPGKLVFVGRQQSGGTHPSVIPLDRPNTTLGRGAAANVKISTSQGNHLSRVHATISRRATSKDGCDYVLVAKGSNGCTVNGFKVLRRNVAYNDEIVFGGVLVGTKVGERVPRPQSNLAYRLVRSDSDYAPRGATGGTSHRGKRARSDDSNGGSHTAETADTADTATATAAAPHKRARREEDDTSKAAAKQAAAIESLNKVGWCVSGPT